MKLCNEYLGDGKELHNVTAGNSSECMSSTGKVHIRAVFGLGYRFRWDKIRRQMKRDALQTFDGNDDVRCSLNERRISFWSSEG